MSLTARDIREYFYKKSLREIFNAAAHEAYKSFPDLKKLVVISTKEPLYASDEAVEDINRSCTDIKQVIASHSRELEEMKAVGYAVKYDSDNPLDPDENNLIIIDTNKHEESSTKIERAQEIALINTFDHEIGHLVVSGGMPENSSEHIAECAADAFATLRHIQRFGSSTNFSKTTPIKEHLALYYHQKNHYTSATIKAVEELALDPSININELALKQTAQLAGKLAREHAVPEAILDKVHKAYAEPRKKFAKQEINTKALLKEIAQVILENLHDRDIYEAGRLSLLRPDIKTYTDHARKQDPFWSEAISKMEEYEKKSGFKINSPDIDRAQFSLRGRLLAKVKSTINF